MSGVAAYFDVDGTLTTTVTLFELLQFDAGRDGRTAEGAAFLADLAALRSRGGGRRAINSAYFRWWAGRSPGEVGERAHEWWAALPAPERFLATSRQRWDKHRSRGHRCVLVSASFSEALAPLANELGADHVITSGLEVVDGVFTGNLTSSMLGDDKRVAVTADAARHGVALADSSGYGDHASDVPFLEILGHPHLVTATGTVEPWMADAGRSRVLQDLLQK